jgi:hypothetical protein
MRKARLSLSPIEGTRWSARRSAFTPVEAVLASGRETARKILAAEA